MIWLVVVPPRLWVGVPLLLLGVVVENFFLVPLFDLVDVGVGGPSSSSMASA